MVKKIATIKLLNLVLLAQLAAGLAALYLNQSFIFFIFAAFALLSRMVLGFFEANLAEGGLIEFSFKRALWFFPVFVLLCAFFGWIFRELLREMVHANTETMSAADEFFLRAPYLLMALVFLIGISAIAAGGILRGYRQK